MSKWSLHEQLRIVESHRWEWRISMVFCSIIFLLLALFAGSAALGEWQERTFRIGMFWGVHIPLGYLVWTLMIYLDTGKHEEEGCLLVLILAAISIILIILGFVSGVVIAAFLPTYSTGFILSLSVGMGTIIMAKNSYALYTGT
ncbi:MAG TPA: hypothetical protein VMY36_00665 [Patescibacteria group bacterium]|nr:hypothetical protein [Patescibacteria group bacterium]